MSGMVLITLTLSRGLGIECYYMMIRRKLKMLNDLKRKIMDELNLNPTLYDIKIIYRYPQEVLHEWIKNNSIIY